MDRRHRRPITSELEDLERELAALTLRVAALRNSVGVPERSLAIGDRVRFEIIGRGRTTGVVVATTAKRVRIRQDITGHIFIRAPHNATLL